MKFKFKKMLTFEPQGRTPSADCFSICLSCFSFFTGKENDNQVLVEEGEEDISQLLTSCPDCLESHLARFEKKFFG